MQGVEPKGMQPCSRAQNAADAMRRINSDCYLPDSTSSALRLVVFFEKNNRLGTDRAFRQWRRPVHGCVL